MKEKREKMSGKTVRKMYRLAKELEAANHMKVIWKSGIYEGRRVFAFEPVPKKETPYGAFVEYGFAYSIREALAHFYRETGDLLNNAVRFTPEERKPYITVKDDYLPGRYIRDLSVYAKQGHHGKQVVLA